MDGFPVWVVGIGSNQGDDSAGWNVIAQLQAMQPTGIEALTISDPLGIADVPKVCRLLIVIDACRGAGLPGSVHRFVWPDSRLIATGGVSSHGIGVVAMLRLTEALGRLPPRVVLFAIEAESAEPDAAMNPLVEAAITKVVAMVIAETSARTGRDE